MNGINGISKRMMRNSIPITHRAYTHTWNALIVRWKRTSRTWSNFFFVPYVFFPLFWVSMLMLFYFLHCAWAVYVTVDFLQTVSDENGGERKRGDWRKSISIHTALSIEIELLIAHDFELHTAHATHTNDTNNNNPTCISMESSNKLIFVTNTSFLVHVCFETVALFTGTLLDAVCMHLWKQQLGILQRIVLNVIMNFKNLFNVRRFVQYSHWFRSCLFPSSWLRDFCLFTFSFRFNFF